MARKATSPERLAEYERKRDFAATPEPTGKKRSASTALRFVIQKHAASRLHYDFRLEADGVLASWAIPKGPSLDTHERRLAMHVEDHPYDYRTFEGIIPKGNYGAGTVIVWDEGTYALAEGTDPAKEIAGGKIKFILNGKKMHGMFSLVKIKAKGGESGDPWLLIKDKDQYVDPSYDVNDHPESAVSGKTLDDIAGSKNAKTWQSNRPAEEPAKKKRTPAKRAVAADPFPRDVKPELATLVEAPFDGDDWLFEVKWDGYRAILSIDAEGKVSLTSRNGLDLLRRFKELDTLGGAFRSLPAIIDGEICVLDAEGRSSFQALQQIDVAARVKGKSRAQLTFIAFDLIYAGGRDVRALPLEERKAKLEKLIVPDRGVLFSQHIVGRGKDFFALAQRESLEGIIGKRRDSPYRMARSRDWVKIKAKHEEEFVIGGWTEPKGSRSDFGAILLGYYEKGKLIFAGQAGTGFNQKLLREIGAELRKRERKTSPFESVPKMRPEPHFVKPELVAQIAFHEWTDDGLLRQPVFLGLRVDKDASDVKRERAKPV